MKMRIIFILYTEVKKSQERLQKSEKWGKVKIKNIT